MGLVWTIKSVCGMQFAQQLHNLFIQFYVYTKSAMLVTFTY